MADPSGLRRHHPRKGKHMNTVLVWVLVTFGSYQGALVYSPPMPDKAMCEQLQKSKCLANSWVRG